MSHHRFLRPLKQTAQSNHA